MSSGKILIIDDDAAFLRMYEDRLGEEGYLVETVTDARGALAKLDEPGWDAVLIDQKLQGEGGPDSGLDLIGEAARRAPGAKAFLVTAYATRAAITRAFREGAYDYLQKDEFFSALLAPKLRNAVEAVRALRMAELSGDETEATIRETWAAAESEKDANRKGKLLEDLMVLIFKTVPGFHQTTLRRQNELEEIDLLIQNASTDPLWVNERTSYILVECKNWSKPVGVPELTVFIGKIAKRYGRCRLGFFIAPGGVTRTFKGELAAKREGDHLVVLVDRDALLELVGTTDRNAVLKKLHERAVAELNGH
jgi:ActR/RegA family two-component response regulator